MMPSEKTALVLGGLIPALFFGFSSIFAKAAARSGVAVSVYLALIGAAILFTAVCFYLYVPERTLNLVSGSYSFLAGLSWAVAAGFVLVALSLYNAPLAKLVPIYNSNTLVAVLLGLVVFSEWREVSLPRLLVGAVLIIVGGIIVSNS